ncbi:FliI/YscN family ATPase [Myxococcota bacterium]|nr:FliI/YscN family ATPase [Myxococcota bacterium]
MAERRAAASARIARPGEEDPARDPAVAAVASALDGLPARLREVAPLSRSGRVTDVIGTLVEGTVPGTALGGLCRIQPAGGGRPVLAEVVGFREKRVLMMPYDDPVGLSHGSPVIPVRRDFEIPVGRELLGRVLDGLGEPMDGRGPARGVERVPVREGAPPPLERTRIREPLDIGVRAIDAALTTAKGQRVGIMAGSGVGKSTLLGMIARNVKADVNVIGLVGERGREVREFLERDLGPEGMARSVVVCATSDRSPVLRVKAAFVATRISEWFRDQGADVLLMMDSLTRFCMAQREVGLAVGEPPTARGYTPSVFSLLPRLLERAGTAARGSITGFYTVLVEGDDHHDPVADAARSILDGHLVLTRELADRNHFPPIDVLRSKSRVMNDVVGEEHRDAAGALREVLADYAEAEDLVNLGAYREGSNPRIDRALERMPGIRSFLRQGILERSSLPEAVAAMRALVGGGEAG